MGERRGERAREQEVGGTTGAGRWWRWRCWWWWWGGGGGGGLFMMLSPINTAEVMTQIVLPLHTVTPVELRALLRDTPRRRWQRKALCCPVQDLWHSSTSGKKKKGKNSNAHSSLSIPPSIHPSIYPSGHPSINLLSSVVDSRLLTVFNGCVLLPGCLPPRWSSHCGAVQPQSAGSVNLLLN